MYQPLNGVNKAASSICPTLESVLLDSVLNNRRDGSIEQLLSTKSELLDHIYSSKGNKTILLIAISEETVKAYTVELLLKSGANVHYTNNLLLHWEALHFAAWRSNSRILESIVKKFTLPQQQINAIAGGENALHILIKYGKSELKQEFVECAKILVNHGVDVNFGDSNFVSPILLAAQKGFKDIIQFLIERKRSSIDLDSHQLDQKTARDIIIAENLYDGTLPDKIVNSNETDENILFRFIKVGNESGFLNFKNGEISDFVNADDTSSTLLQLCCMKGFSKAAAHLIDKGADPNKTTQKNQKKPIEIAAGRGFHEIFQMLLDHPKFEPPKNLLMRLLTCYDKGKRPGIDHAKCYDYLLRNPIIKTYLVNEQDEFGHSPLHYAVRYSDVTKVEDLLSLGASLGTKNQFGFMPVQDIDPEVFERHLDRCIQFERTMMSEENFEVTFKYGTLIPPQCETETVPDTTDQESNLDYAIKQETEVVAYMSQAPQLKHLLQHPVIVGFLFVKWHRIRWLFYVNLFFYIAFCLSLGIYIFTSYSNLRNREPYPSNELVITTSFVVFVITFIILFFRELFQIAVLRLKYFKISENYIEISLLIISGFIIFLDSPSDDTRKQLSSISILLVAFALILLIGQHPKWSTYVVMLKTVSFNFFKLLTWFSVLIVAFALSFYILFSQINDSPKNATDSCDGKDFFTDAGNSFFKTIVMTTGEFDASSLKFNQFPVTSKLIFCLFIFLIVIILLNLLNGLAVSDTQMIKNNAELEGHVARAQHIHYVESMLFGNIRPPKYIEKLSRICCCFPFIKDWQYTLPLAKTTCIFPLLNNYEMRIYPNKKGEIDLPTTKKSFHVWSTNMYLDEQTLRKINTIILANKDGIKEEKETIFNKGIDKTLGDVKLNIYMLSQKVDVLINLMRERNA